MSNEATVSGTALPAFDRIRATEVETTIRELLDRNRGEVKGLEAQPHPTFENTVLPLEQLSHRLSRTWSPISHLNGVLNSEELRASYNACLPLLSQGLPPIKTWIHLGQATPPAGWLSYEALIAQTEPADDAERRDNDLAGIFYTGGSTGKAKGAMLSHDNLISNAMNAIALVGSGAFKARPASRR